ncbi:HDOD domain-containing protein [Xanthomonas arboricola pv. corylina]|uniref:HDOD domain-containing protein n=1 Tax=Xanthomonas arboricola TaxID=56448 RepID=UPI0006ACE941|nr:HDOD domain-containing protein [Xanthomonas arboricola]MDN0204179.1 HDOD domain-containing protein [Xanthomonas arboricola pv. corylina]MDN0207872.1 HDOD domain-containing protein [Xanthomonas arboricola pv. corylina]MDN0212295.1 HDOD domain-containing protein [Xanthomonas arboricola pv. corylina]MDN0217166.1 HDOD domain-containing protein [Xanthomonas arboricola pv. corylina]PPU58410.1 HDOD domain-containing protein [Xanthomonas arboricola pv. corylina]
MIVLLLAAGLLAGLGLAGVVAWLLLRQRARTTAASAASATVTHAAAAPHVPQPAAEQVPPPPQAQAHAAAAAQPLPSGPPPMQPLLRRMYAAVMSTPALADGYLPTDPAQAAVLAAVGAALDHVDLRPQLLPRRPQLLPQLMRAVNDPDASGRGIAAIIAQDPALAANLLRIANSALYRPQGGPLESLERAVVHIGTEGVRQIVAAAVMQPVLSLEGGLYARLPAAVWDYALRTAAAAAAYMRERGGDTLSAQLAGLLQGLGAVVILRVLRDAYAERPSLPYSLEVAAALVERHTAAVAKTIATTWDLPAALGTALDEQRPEHDTTLLTSSLGMALRYGRLAAALAMLARHGAEQEEHALGVLSTLEPDHAANAALWQRLVAASVE